jgi:hypothetical protein
MAADGRGVPLGTVHVRIAEPGTVVFNSWLRFPSTWPVGLRLLVGAVPALVVVALLWWFGRQSFVAFLIAWLRRVCAIFLVLAGVGCRRHRAGPAMQVPKAFRPLWFGFGAWVIATLGTLVAFGFSGGSARTKDTTSGYGILSSSMKCSTKSSQISSRIRGSAG